MGDYGVEGWLDCFFNEKNLKVFSKRGIINRTFKVASNKGGDRNVS